MRKRVITASLIGILGVFGLTTSASANKHCSVTFYKYADLKGKTVTFHGEMNVRDLDDVEYPDGEDLDNDVGSVGTQPGTYLEIYEDEDFENPKYQLTPSTWTNIEDVESFRVACRDEHGGPLK